MDPAGETGTEEQETGGAETTDIVINLDESNFDSFVSEKEHVIVMFFAPCKFTSLSHKSE